MRLRYQITILVVANAFWVLLLLPTFLNPNWRLSQYEEQPLFTQPSEKALEKLESKGVPRDVVALFLRNINGSHETGNSINYILYECDDRFREGNLTNEVFAACAAFTIGYTKHLQQVFDENLQPITVITSSSNSSH